MNESTAARQSSLMARTAQTFFSMFGVLGIGVLSAIILSRGLSPEDRGIFLGISMYSGFILGLCDVGIYMTTIYLWGKGAVEQRADIFKTLLVWALVTGGVAVVVVLFVTQWLIEGHLVGEIRMAAYVLYATMLTGPLASMLSGVLAAQQRFSLINLIRVGVPGTLTVLWLMYYLTGILSIIACLYTTALISFSSLIPYLWQSRRLLMSRGKFRLSIFRTGIWYALKSFGGSVITVLGNSGTQILLFSLTPAALAFYQTASSATGVLWSIPKAIGLTSFPYMVIVDRTQLHEKMCRFFRLTILFTGLGAIALGSVIPYLIPLFFGDAYAPAIWPALLLLPNALFGGLSDLLGNALNSTGRTLHNTIATGCYVSVALGSMTLTLDAWGISGAAISMGLGFLISFIVRYLWYSYTIQRISVRQLLPAYGDLKAVVQMGLTMMKKRDHRVKAKLTMKEGSS
ncbi:MAG: hypothetical protein P0Y55_02285 [Candidatus Cohnella colombiensis]|uniref:Polysaccharide biosynthesis protein C-terminal domain-containing protein n=1 Tax=Candidatus Cohnella colombiensis TaxID=3121368 RepID=A0AA95F125_9BACL|nr:MAG: hypothetical protein P0Y55_02285 [Cohnella sp.]